MPRTNIGKPRELIALEEELRGEYPKLVNKQQVKTIIGVLNGAIVTEWLEGLPTYQVGKRYRWKIEDVARQLYESRVS